MACAAEKAHFIPIPQHEFRDLSKGEKNNKIFFGEARPHKK